MSLVAAAFAFAPGLAIGSFLNVVAARVPLKRSIVSPPSACMGCGSEIAWYDNIPLVSWLVLRGRCRSCGQPISPRYPLVEGLTALLFAAIVVVKGFGWDLVWELPFAAMLIAVAAIDLDHRIVPNRVLLPAAVWGVVSAALVRLSDLPELAAWGAGAFTFLLVAALAYPAGMGMGDVKLAGVMGLYLGSSVLPAMLTAFLAGSVYGVGVIARHGASARKSGVPFAPFLALGGLVGLLAGQDLVDLYRNTFL
jgi:leader peptidase (prepilin peptidase)/N-methyltransferase